MIDVKVIFHDFSQARIECQDSMFFDLKDHFSFFVDGYQFNPKYRYGGWSGKIYLIDNNRMVPIGLATQIKKFCDEMGYTCEIDKAILTGDDCTREYFDKWLSSKKIYSGSTEITPHFYQSESVWQVIHHGRRLLSLPTSAGKSLIQALLSRYYLEHYEGKVLVVVPTTSLTIQMKKDYIDYRLFRDEDILEIRSGTERDSRKARVYVSTWQTACKMPPEWLEQFGMVLNDETHNATAKNVSTLVKSLKNCIFKAGLSGTLKDGKANLMQYIGMFGQVYSPVTTSELMEKGMVTKLKINSLFLEYPEPVCVGMKGMDYQTEVKSIIGYKKRNKVITGLASKLSKKGDNVFVMFRYSKHGKSLFEELSKDNEKVYYISGEISTEKRDELKGILENDTGIIVVASYGVFSTGISIKNLHHVIFAHGTKSKITVLQSIGRVLRKHESKDCATLWDIIDCAGIKPKEGSKSKKKYIHMNHSLKHGIERLDRYFKEKFDVSVKKIQL